MFSKSDVKTIAKEVFALEKETEKAIRRAQEEKQEERNKQIYIENTMITGLFISSLRHHMHGDDDFEYEEHKKYNPNFRARIH